MNAVRWVPGCEDGKEVIVSGSVDRSLRIWKESQGEVDSFDKFADGSFLNVRLFQTIVDQSIVLRYSRKYLQQAPQMGLFIFTPSIFRQLNTL